MSSVTSSFAQVGRRIAYFRPTATVTTYTIDETGPNTWGTPASSGVTYGTSDLLEDMGVTARISATGQIFRKIRVVTQVPAGGSALAYWICMPGGEYPIAGVGSDATTALGVAVAPVVRLG